MNRRGFLASIGAAVAGAALAPLVKIAQVASAPPPMAPCRPLTVKDFDAALKKAFPPEAVEAMVYRESPWAKLFLNRFPYEGEAVTVIHRDGRVEERKA